MEPFHSALHSDVWARRISDVARFLLFIVSLLKERLPLNSRSVIRTFSEPVYPVTPPAAPSLSLSPSLPPSVALSPLLSALP